MNGRKPAPGLDLQPWLGGGQDADVVSVAFQEIVPLSAGNVMTGEQASLIGTRPRGAVGNTHAALFPTFPVCPSARCAVDIWATRPELAGAYPCPQIAVQ